MELLRDDPIIHSIMETGYPPWIRGGYEDDDDDFWEEGDDGDVYFGNDTQGF